MNEKIKISEAEWEVMRQLWSRHPQTGNELAECLCETQDWQPKTVKTLISRLLAKKAIEFAKKGREYYYVPKIKEKDYVKHASQSFLQRVFGGAVKPMLATLIEEQKLSKQEILELKAILDEKARE